MDDEIVYTIALSWMAGLNDIQKKTILEFYGSAVAVFKEHQNQEAGFTELNLIHKNIFIKLVSKLNYFNFVIN